MLNSITLLGRKEKLKAKVQFYIPKKLFYLLHLFSFLAFCAHLPKFLDLDTLCGYKVL